MQPAGLHYRDEMSTAGEREDGVAAARSRGERRWDRVRILLVVAWLLIAVAVATLGERTASWAELSGAVATGAVDKVRVVGALPAGSTGYALVDVHWRSGLWRHVTEVAQTRGAGAPSKHSLKFDEGVSEVLRADPGAQLTRLRPGLDVARDASRPPRSTLAGWEAPGWLGIAAFGAIVVGFAALVAGPEPWRATRWA